VKHFAVPLKEKVRLIDAIEELKQRQIIYGNSESNPKFEQLVEHVLRRNVHLHERGHVHEKYTKGVGKLHSISPKLVQGDYAVINQEYFRHAIDRCNECVDQIYSFIISEQT